jgi:four helix bundle protein
MRKDECGMRNERREENPDAGKARGRDLRERTKQFALTIIRFCAKFPDTPEGRLVRGQLLRCGTSPGAQYREADRARSTPEFISKMESALQELAETAYWLEITRDARIMPEVDMQPILVETNELIAIFTSSIKTAKLRRSASV